MALTRKLVYIFIFTTNHFQVSDTQREREREERVTHRVNQLQPSNGVASTPAPSPTSRSHHHWDRTPNRSHPSRSHHHRRLIHPKPISSASSLPMTDLVTLSSLPMTDLVSILSPMTDLSFSLNFWSLSLPPSLSLTESWSLTNGVVLIFFFLSLYIEIFYYKICLVAKKMGEKVVGK